MCCGSRSIGYPRFAFCWMNFQPLPKGGDARLWASFFVNASSTEGAGGCATLVWLRSRYTAFKPTQSGRRCTPWDGGLRSKEFTHRQALANMGAHEVGSEVPERKLCALWFGRMCP